MQTHELMHGKDHLSNFLAEMRLDLLSALLIKQSQLEEHACDPRIDINAQGRQRRDHAAGKFKRILPSPDHALLIGWPRKFLRLEQPCALFGFEPRNQCIVTMFNDCG